LLETVVLASDADGLIFENISQDYKHLEVRAVVRGSGTATVETHLLRINEQSSLIYSSHALIGNGSSVSSIADTTQSLIDMGLIVGGGGESDAFSPQVMSILDYSSTSKFKTIRSLTAMNYDLDEEVRLTSGLYQSTSAITSLTFLAGGGEVYAARSRFSLYGIKG